MPSGPCLPQNATVSMPFLVSMMNSLMMSAARAGTEINWEDVARNFKPAEVKRAPAKEKALDKGKAAAGIEGAK